MESVDSSPNYLRPRSIFDAKKENSPGGSECDEIMSASSSTSGSAVNGPYARKLSNNGIKSRSSTKNTLKNFGNTRSFRRRSKPRVLQSPVVMSDEEDSLVESSVASPSSPHYLKATTASEGKKSRFQSTFDASGGNSSHSSQPKLSLSRTSSLRNVRILRRASFRPKRSLLRHSKVSDDAGADRATYSSTIKDSKFPAPVELPLGGQESEKSSAMKVCRYHHCSLHGHCRGSDDPAPPPKRFPYKRRQSLKKQKSMRPKVVPDRKKKLNKIQTIPEVESSNQGGFSDSMAVSDAESKNVLDSQEENYPNDETRIFGDGYEDVQESYLVELAFGEMSFPERSYRDNLNIMRKYSSEEQDFGGTSIGRNGYCSRCSCHNGEVTTTPERDTADLSLREITPSSLGGNNKKIPQNASSVALVTSSPASFKKPKEPADIYVDEGAGKDGPDTPVVFDEITEKGSAFSSSASCNSQSSTDSNSEEDADSTTESSTAGDSKVNEVARVEDSATNSPTHIEGRLQFSKPAHMSMWQLIHQHMSSNLAVDSVRAKDSGTLSRESSDTSIGTYTNEAETQENELRKLFAVKLVREAIEKILLPEVQDQASDDQSTTSESTPRSEVMENNQNKAFTQKSDAERVKGDVSSNSNEETVVAGDASGKELKDPEKQVAGKSEKKAPKHWSNLKKWILLQRFIKELEKVRKFNPRKPQHLPLNPDPEAEKVNLRPQTVNGRKNAEEWMLDHALRQAVSQLAPTQKKKVALLVKAFETVVPPQEDSPLQFRAPRLRKSSLAARLASDASGSIVDSASHEMSVKRAEETEKADEVNDKFEGSSDAINEKLTSNEKSVSPSTCKNELPASKQDEDTNISLRSELSSEDLTSGNENVPTMQGLQDSISDCTEGKAKEGSQSNQMDTKNHIKMWHMIYQHVVSGIVEKVGRQLLEGEEDDEGEDNLSPATSNGYLATDELMEQNLGSSNLSSGLTKSDALKLVKEAVDEILLPEIQDDSSDTQSSTGESAPDQDIPERNCSEIGEGKGHGQDIASSGEDLKAVSLVSKKSKNWSKLKRLMLLKRSIKALEKAREVKPQAHQVLPQTPDPEAEKVDLRRQMTDERKKAEQWMLDYAVQHIVTRLTPARKRRVSMLVEAFEAVVPFPEI